MEYENLKILSIIHQLLKHQITIKTITQFLVSVSAFSLIYYYSSSWCCFMLHSLKFYLSAIQFHSLDKRWIFLICNGILVVLLANTSDLVSSESPSNSSTGNNSINFDHVNNDHMMMDNKILLEAADDDEPIYQNAVSDDIQVEEEEEEEEDEFEESQDDQAHECFGEEEDHQGDELGLLIEENHEEKYEMGSESDHDAEDGGIRTYYVLEEYEHFHHHDQNIEENLEAAVGSLLEKEEEEEEEEEEEVLVEEEEQQEEVFVEEEEEDDENGLMLEKLSAEELNKKFEDFIRKMKQELRIEAQQQLAVAVK